MYKASVLALRARRAGLLKKPAATASCSLGLRVCRGTESGEAYRQGDTRTVVEACGLRGAEPEKPSRAAPMEPMVTAMCSQDRKVRSLAKKVLGSMRCGMVALSRASACRV